VNWTNLIPKARKDKCRDLTDYDCDYEPKSPRDFEDHLLDEHKEGNKK